MNKLDENKNTMPVYLDQKSIRSVPETKISSAMCLPRNLVVFLFFLTEDKNTQKLLLDRTPDIKSYY